MTVIANVKATLATAKSIQTELGFFAQLTNDVKAKAIFHECMTEMDTVIHDLSLRVKFMMAEELEYRNS